MIDTRLLGGGPPLGEVEALVIFAGVCRGVEALHKHTPPWAHRFVLVLFLQGRRQRHAFVCVCTFSARRWRRGDT